MTQNIEQIPTIINDEAPNVTDEEFYAVIERLKSQKALPKDSFAKNVPFFNFSSISKESQIKELFQDTSDPNFYKSLIKNMMTSPEEKNSDMLNKRLSAMQVMSFSQITLYKVLPCLDQSCPNRPREVATHNQYKDYEYECPFYHHDKDRRRMVVPAVIDEEFVYKANYGSGNAEREKHSLNYFESMFHPLYYKMFRCKREYCNFSHCCPFYHSEEEKKTWDKVFSNFIRKDRISYVKDKQKYYEHQSNPANRNAENRILRSGGNNSDHNNSNPASPNTQNEKSRAGFKPKNNKFQTSPPQQNAWRSEKNYRPNSGKKSENSGKKKNYSNNFRKGSEESTEGNSSPVNFGHFYDQKEVLTNRAC